MAQDTVTPDSSAWARFRNRVRFGLATQEVLDRLARRGLVIYPYYFVYEPVRVRPELERLDEGLEFRELGSSDAPLIATLPERPRHEAKVRSLMDHATCIAALERNQLVAYSWYTRDKLRGLAGADPMAALPADCAYLFDMFVCRSVRGRNVAAVLRNHVHRRLAAQGIRHACSISLAFNQSTRRFKAKLGAVEAELRVLLRVKPFAALDVRLWRKPWTLSTPWLHVARVREA
jgi:GNAT superfamily N-acetyltransferase